MAEPAPFSNVSTTADIASKRKLAQALMTQGTDASPVGHWTQALARAVQGGVGGYYNAKAETGEKDRQNSIVQALAGSPNFASLSAGERGLMAQDPELMQNVAGKVFNNKLVGPPPTDDIREFEYAKKGGYAQGFDQWMAAKRRGAGNDYAKQLVYGRDAQGNVVPMQAGSGGDLTASRLPPGVTINKEPNKIDAGTHWIMQDPTTLQTIATIPKNVAEVERLKVAGEAQGKAQVDLPGVESNAQNITGYIDKVAGDKNLDRMLGFGGYLPNISTGARTLQTKIDQLNSQGFVMAFQNLKGAGAITEQEGQAATAALSRLKEMVQSGKDYREALADFRGEVTRLTEVARRKAGAGGPNGNAGFSQPGQAPQAAAAPKRMRYNPATGQVE